MRTTTRPSTRRETTTRSAGIAGAVGLALCCGGALLATAFGLGALAALLVAPWFLLPVVLLAAGIFFWRGTRRDAACALPAAERKEDA